ncbi:MAG: ABC transporter permease [Alphaproteobacteria bacterium]|nr:ABC transporter permease [Alphaproteobacteria bacterium]
MRRALANIFWLATKEVRSFLHDFALLGLMIYSFSLAIYAQSQSTSQELRNAAIAIVDEDRSALSRGIAQAFLPPYFKAPVHVTASEVDRLLDTARYTFVLDIPPHFARDVLARRTPAVQVNVDATAAMQAGVGAGYIQQIVTDEAARYAARVDAAPSDPVGLAVHIAYNPNVLTSWFNSIMGIVNNVTMLAIILAGAAVIREREHGTMDHLLMMPLTPFQIAMAKIAGNGAVITVATWLSLTIVVRLLLRIPISGSVPLFIVGVMLYLFFSTSIGIFLGTVARSMPQLGLLYILVAVPMMLLSGGNTPLESMPLPLQYIMQASPSTHFVSFAQAILFRGAGIGVVWPQFAAVVAVAVVFLALALLRFRRVTAASIG